MAVEPPAGRAGSGAFFILCYPGESDDSVLETLRFATSLPLDYLGLSMPYPLPGTALYARVGDLVHREWRQQEGLLLDHVLTYRRLCSRRDLPPSPSSRGGRSSRSGGASGASRRSR